MDGDLSEHQPKQERLRTRWTASLDKIFADLVVEQIQLGNRPNNVFDKKTWNLIRDEFNKQTDLNFNNNQLRKHLDVLRTRYCSVKSAFDQTDFVIDDSSCIAFDHWLWEDNGAQPKPETAKIKDCPIYEQLCTIFADTGADGKYAQSSHYEGFDKSIGTEDREKFISCPDTGTPQAKTPSSAKLAKGNAPSVQKSSKNKGERKRKHSDEAGPTSGQTNDEELNEAMAGALLDMVAASKLRAAAISTKQHDRFSITNCVEALDEIELMEGIDSRLYVGALDLFEDPNLRETFISLKSNKVKLTWLQGKCGSASHI